jgi:dephospho-CoA kinase
MVETVGLTGGIASGKTTAANILRNFGAYIVDADAIAREVVVQESEGLAAIVALFGSSFLLEDGTLNRPMMASTIFADPAKRALLDSIMLPRIQAVANQKTAIAPRGLTVYDAPLLVETGSYKKMTLGIILLAPTREQQLTRLMQRNNLTQQEAEQRINAQMTVEEKLHTLKDRQVWVINNNSTRQELAVELHRIWKELLPWETT